MRINSFLIFLSLTVAAVSTGAPLGAGTLRENIEEILEEKRQRYGTPGMVVTVIRRGKISGTFTSGYADRENRREIEAETLIPAASLTKLVTAVLVMHQVEKGLLNLDAPVNDYLPAAMHLQDRSGRPSAANLGQLLSHNAGLPVSWKPIKSKGQKVETLGQYLSQNLQTIYPPGEKIIYANDGFSLAGFAAARVSQDDFAQLTAKIILKPLGMHESTFASAWSVPQAKLARAYGSLMAPGAVAEHNDVTAALPAGGLITNAPELARFALMLLNGGELDGVRILSKESVEKLFRIRAKPYPSSQMGFGLGFGVHETGGRKIVWWDGGLAGVANRMILHPASQSAVVLLSNQSDNAASSEAANAIFDVLVPPVVLPHYQPPESELARFTGTYRFYDAVDPALWFLRYGIDLTISSDNGSLHYHSRLFRGGRLVPLAPGLFRMTDSRLAGSDVYFDGQTVFFLDLSARRVHWYNSLPALVCYALIFFGVFCYLVFRSCRFLWRRLRH